MMLRHDCRENKFPFQPSVHEYNGHLKDLCICVSWKLIVLSDVDLETCVSSICLGFFPWLHWLQCIVGASTGAKVVPDKKKARDAWTDSL